MAQYQILYWRHIPLGVKATDLNGIVRENLPDRFQEAVDQLALQDGKTSTTLYTQEFHWSRTAEREGTAVEVARQVAAGLVARYPEGIPLEPSE